MTWRRRRINEEINRMRNRWKKVKELSRNRLTWRNFTEALWSILELRDSSGSHKIREMS
jgi:hypothetical protein